MAQQILNLSRTCTHARTVTSTTTLSGAIWRCLCICLAFLVVSFHSSAFGQTLKVGDPAPPLHVTQWASGTPVEAFKPGRVYVIEFGSPHLGPWFSHLSELTALQKKHSETMSAIAVLSPRKMRGLLGVQEDLEKNRNRADEDVREFLAKWGDQIGFAVVSDGDRETASAYLDAADVAFVPCAFLVGGDGNIAWIGDPCNGFRLDDEGNFARIGDPRNGLEVLVEGAIARAATLPAPAMSDDFKAAVARGLEAAKAHDYDTALVAFDEAAKLRPTDSDVQVYIAAASLGAKQRDRGLAAVTRAIELSKELANRADVAKIKTALEALPSASTPAETPSDPSANADSADSMEYPSWLPSEHRIAYEAARSLMLDDLPRAVAAKDGAEVRRLAGVAKVNLMPLITSEEFGPGLGAWRLAAISAIAANDIDTAAFAYVTLEERRVATEEYNNSLAQGQHPTVDPTWLKPLLVALQKMPIQHRVAGIRAARENRSRFVLYRFRPVIGGRPAESDRSILTHDASAMVDHALNLLEGRVIPQWTEEAMRLLQRVANGITTVPAERTPEWYGLFTDGGIDAYSYAREDAARRRDEDGLTTQANYYSAVAKANQVLCLIHGLGLVGLTVDVQQAMRACDAFAQASCHGDQISPRPNPFDSSTPGIRTVRTANEYRADAFLMLAKLAIAGSRRATADNHLDLPLGYSVDTWLETVSWKVDESLSRRWLESFIGDWQSAGADGRIPHAGESLARMLWDYLDVCGHDFSKLSLPDDGLFGISIWKKAIAALPKSAAEPPGSDVTELQSNLERNLAAYQLNLGNYYTDTKEFSKAIALYQEAANSSSKDVAAIALVAIGNRYANGEGVPRSVLKRDEYFVQAARLGDEQAQQVLRDKGKKW